MLMRAAMKTGLWTLLFLWFALLLFQQIRYPQIRLNPISSRILHPFDTRLHYRIGQIDPRFGLSMSEAQQLSEQADHIWQQGTGHIWFVYDPHARLQINFVYDERQNQTNQRVQQLQQIQQTQAQQQQQQQFLDAKKQSIAQSQMMLDRKQAEFQVALAQYNQTVEQINQQDGANPQLKSIFDQQKFYLEQQKQQLNQAIIAHNQVVSTSNQQVDHYNQTNQQIRQSIDRYNQHYAARQFDKGIFNGREINVYEFENQDDLRLVLAHELGHALGLKHLYNNPKALMYPTLKQQNLEDFQLTTDDIALLDENTSLNNFLTKFRL